MGFMINQYIYIYTYIQQNKMLNLGHNKKTLSV